MRVSLMRPLVETPLHVLGKAQHSPIFPGSGSRVTPVPGSRFLRGALQGCGFTQISAVERGNVAVPARGRTWLQGEQSLLPACQGNVG